MQFGVVLFITSLLSFILGPFLFLVNGEFVVLPLILFQSGIWFLFLAAILPENKQDEWGSMWPLVGYDNAIDAIYVRGPWLVRFEELEEAEVQDNVGAGMTTLFGERGKPSS